MVVIVTTAFLLTRTMRGGTTTPLIVHFVGFSKATPTAVKAIFDTQIILEDHPFSVGLGPAITTLPLVVALRMALNYNHTV